MGVIGVNDNAKMIQDNWERMLYLGPNIQNLIVTNSDVSVAWAKTIYSGGTIKTNGNVVIQWGRNYRFRAETSVEMVAGFEASAGAEYEAIVLPCGDDDAGMVDFGGLPDIGKINKFLAFNSEHSKFWETMKVFPNPASDYFVVKGWSDENIVYYLSFLSPNGKIISTQNFVQSDGNMLSSKMNIDTLPAGIYYLEIRSSIGERSIFPLIKR
jgi:hypothetical protein